MTFDERRVGYRQKKAPSVSAKCLFSYRIW